MADITMKYQCEDCGGKHPMGQTCRDAYKESIKNDLYDFNWLGQNIRESRRALFALIDGVQA